MHVINHRNKPREPQPGVIDPFRPYLAERIMSFPALTARRLWRELKDRGYPGGYTVLKEAVRELRPPRTPARGPFHLDHFEVVFTDEPGVKPIV
jgi:transposase